MALIYIKRRREPIEVSNDRARRIKLMRFGSVETGEGKLEPTELIDLGDEWAGEIGQISAVEMRKEQKETPKRDDDKEHREYLAKQLAMPIEERAKQLSRFKMSWWVRGGMRPEQKEPPQTVMDFAYQMSLNFFKKNPNAPEVDMSIFEPLLIKHWGEKKPKTMAQGLSEKFRLSTDGQE